MSKVIALRGATTLQKDDPLEMDTRVKELILEIFRVNDFNADQIISAIVTATTDIKCKYPATSARIGGLDAVPIIGAQEVDVAGGLPLCIRIMLHVNVKDEISSLKSVYLHEAQKLRPDLRDD